MADILLKVDETVMPEIAKAIMSKTGKSDPLKITDFASEIAGISGSGGSSGYSDLACLGIEYGHEVGGFECVIGEEEISISDMRFWTKNAPASSAYRTITYDYILRENKCSCYGVNNSEVIFFEKVLKSGKTYNLSFDYYSPSNIVGKWEDPYAPFVGFFPVDNNVISGAPALYSLAYAKTVLPTGVMNEYKSFQCTYNPTETITAYIGLCTGSTTDSVSVEFCLKNIEFTEEDS